MKIIRLLLGLLIFTVSMTLLYLSMRAVMNVGGYCAEGGPYAIETHCPPGTALFTPLSIFGLLIGGALYFFSSVKNSPKWGYLFWSVIFISLGWNFLDYGMRDPGGIVISWIICALVFFLMGIGPLFIFDRHMLKRIFIGETLPDSGVMLILHTLVVAVGIYLGTMIFALG